MSRKPDVICSTQCSECDALRTEFGKGKSKPELTSVGKVLLAGAATTFGLVFAVTTPFLLPAVRRVCLPYVPATSTQVENIVRLLKGKRGRLVDLGSGDGRIVIEAAKQGLHAEGVELNPWLVWYSRLASVKQGTHKRTAFYRQDLWKTDLSRYEFVVIFGVECMMADLASKLGAELNERAEVLACRFPLPGLKPDRTIGSGIDTVWLYTKHCFK